MRSVWRRWYYLRDRGRRRSNNRVGDVKDDGLGGSFIGMSGDLEGFNKAEGANGVQGLVRGEEKRIDTQICSGPAMHLMFSHDR